MTAGVLAGAEAPEVSDDELPVCAGAVPAPLASVVAVDGSEPVVPAVSVEPVDGAEPLVSAPELGLAGADDVGAAAVAVPVGSAAGAVDAVVAAPLDPADAGGVVAVGLVAVGGAALPVAPLVAPSPAPASPDGGETAGGVNPPVAGSGEFTGVDVEVPPELEVGVVAAADDGAPTGVDVTVLVDVPGVAGGPAIGAARGAGRAGIEASSLSRAVGGAATR